MNGSLRRGSRNPNTSRRPAGAPRIRLYVISGEQTLNHLKFKLRNPRTFWPGQFRTLGTRVRHRAGPAPVGRVTTASGGERSALSELDGHQDKKVSSVKSDLGPRPFWCQVSNNTAMEQSQGLLGPTEKTGSKAAWKDQRDWGDRGAPEHRVPGGTERRTCTLSAAPGGQRSDAFSKGSGNPGCKAKSLD